ncbi:hypothetical protein B0T20DRAFT_350909 [Sordaria brevicollis]|uniref:Uncharacterized protein n=1 Tax=Sordaria brevicollis TaxID=83679 RepID=A0AAE0PI30_SORBR|nr:hypothetical protein B0T20DRAFT_350909 [Sordaria brevicollis]
MALDKTIELTKSDDQSITVTSGTDTFTITFFEVPRVSDNAERRFQRVRKPLANDNESQEDSPGSFFPFKIYGPPTGDGVKEGKKQNGSHFLAIKDDKAFAIRMTGDSKESAFKVKVWIGGVNVLQHTTHGKNTQDYFVVSEQKWVWGKQVGKDTARQFRVFRSGRERLSLRYQLQKNNIKKEVEVEITSRRIAHPHLHPDYFYRPHVPCRMTLGDADEDSSPVYGSCTLPPPPPPTTFHELPSDNRVSPTIVEQGIPARPLPCYQPQQYQFAPAVTGNSCRLYEVIDEPPSIDFPELHHIMEYPHHTAAIRYDPQEDEVVYPACNIEVSSYSPTDFIETCQSRDDSPSIPPPQQAGSQYPDLVDPDLITNISYDYEAPLPQEIEDLLNMPSTRPSNLGDTLPCLPESAAASPRSSSLDVALPPAVVPLPPSTTTISQEPPPTSNQESIHSSPEEDMLTHQMVVGTGGLIEQIVHADKHPEWIDDCTVTIKFKIVDPEYLETEAGVKNLGTTGGNFGEAPNPPERLFRKHAPVVEDPDGLRRDIRSPMEMETEMSAFGVEEPLKTKLPADSGVGLTGERAEGDGEEEGEVTQDFQSLTKEADNQPRGVFNDFRMRKERRKQEKLGGVRIQMIRKQKEKHREPKGQERKSRWRTFVDALRRVLTLGR